VETSWLTEKKLVKTHTDQYLHFDSHHPMQHKLSVSSTLFDRSRTIVSRHRTRGLSAGIPACSDSPFGLLLSKVEHGFSGKTAESQECETGQANKESKTDKWCTGGCSVCKRAHRGN